MLPNSVGWALTQAYLTLLSMVYLKSRILHTTIYHLLPNVPLTLLLRNSLPNQNIYGLYFQFPFLTTHSPIKGSMKCYFLYLILAGLFLSIICI